MENKKNLSAEALRKLMRIIMSKKYGIARRDGGIFTVKEANRLERILREAEAALKQEGTMTNE